MSDPYQHLPLHPGSRATRKTTQDVPKVLVANRGESEFLSLTVRGLGLLACLLPTSDLVKLPFEFSVLQENMAGAQLVYLRDKLIITETFMYWTISNI